MQQPFILSLLLSATASAAAAGQSKARASTSAFEGRQFFDFRNLDSPFVPDPIDNFDQAQNAGATHDYFRSAEWTNAWAIMSWDKPVTDKAPVRMTNSWNNVYIQANNDENAESSTFLTLRTVRHADFQSVAEFDSMRQDYQYVSMKMYARTIGDPGACTAMFTYLLPEGQKVQEADLEILTKDQNNVVHYTNQPGYDPETDTSNPDASREVALKTPWNTWQEHELVWTPGSSDWYVDGEHVASIQFQAPVDPAILIFNSWSDGGSWTGEMAVGGSAELQIQWIEINSL